MNKYILPLLAALLAVVITTTMDFTGYFIFSGLPLFGLVIIFWLVLRMSKAELGLKIGALKYYGIALLYPAVVLGVTVLLAYIYGDFSIDGVKWKGFFIRLGLAAVIGTTLALLTEEGFFRGWLWGAFRKSDLSSTKTLFATSALFTIWHISAVTSGTDYGLPLAQVPIYLTNATLLGLIWGLLRSMSGSILVASFSHAIWNSLAYQLFGFGEKVGILGITNTAFFGPEVGVLGIILNGAFFLWLWNVAKTFKNP